MSLSHRVAHRGGQVASLAAAVLFLVAASGPWTSVAIGGSPAQALWRVGPMAVAGVVLAVLGALAAAAGYRPGRGDAEAAGLGVLAVGGAVFGTALAFLAVTRSGPRVPLPTTIRLQPVEPEPLLVGAAGFPVAGRLLVVATGTVVVLAAGLALRARTVTRYGAPSAPRPPGVVPGPVAAAVAVAGCAAVVIGASVLPWRSTDSGTPERTLWSSGAEVVAGAVLVVVAGVAAAVLLRVRPRPSVGSSVAAVTTTLAGAVGGALLVADRLPGVRPSSPFRLLLVRETTPPLELVAAVAAVLGGTTLVVGAGLALLTAATAPPREPADVVG